MLLHNWWFTRINDVMIPLYVFVLAQVKLKKSIKQSSIYERRIVYDVQKKTFEHLHMYVKAC